MRGQSQLGFVARLGIFAVAAWLGAAIGGCGPPPAPNLSLPDLIARNTAARGGQAAIEAIHNLEVRLRITEPTYTADGVWRVTRDGKMRIDVFIDTKRVFTEAYDGERGWQLPGGAEHAALATATGTAALRHSGQLPTNLLGLHEMAAHGHRLELAARETVEGAEYYILLLTLDDGAVTHYYLDSTTFLITRARVHKALHPDIDPRETTIETVWGDFREVAGTKIPFQAHDTDLATGKLLQTTTLLEAVANVELEPSLFQMP